MQAYLDLTKEIASANLDENTNLSSEMVGKLKTLVDEYPNQLCLNIQTFSRYVDHLVKKSDTTKTDIDSAISIFEKSMILSSNAASVEMWNKYIDLLQDLEDIYPKLTGEDHVALEEARESKLKTIFDKALENVGFLCASSSDIWTKYINFETMNNNLTKANLLYFMALEHPLHKREEILGQYVSTLENLYEEIKEHLKEEEASGFAKIDQKLREKQQQILQQINNSNDKDGFIRYIKELNENNHKLSERQSYEDNLQKPGSTKEKLASWQQYIDFEISQNENQRAKLLYEQALNSSVEAQNDVQMWLKQMNFIQNTLKDVSLVRARFEQKLQNSKLMPNKSKIDILIENAIFEEEQQNAPKARKIFEQLEQEIAPGLVKATMGRINFEKRQGNEEKAKELYQNALAAALSKKDKLQVAYITAQSSQFLASKCGDLPGALAVYSQATSTSECCSKQLYLSYCNFVSTNMNSDDTDPENTSKAQDKLLQAIFDKVVKHLESHEDLQDVCSFFIAHLEKLPSVESPQLLDLKQQLQEKGQLNSENKTKITQQISTLLEAATQEQADKLGGVGKKRANNMPVDELENQSKNEK